MWTDEERASFVERQTQLALEQKRRCHRASDNKRRALKAAGGNHTAEDIRQQMVSQSGACAYCGADITQKYHVDHYIPLSMGGSNGAENIVLACPSCNCAKGSLMPDVFLRKILVRGLNAHVVTEAEEMAAVEHMGRLIFGKAVAA